MMLMMKRILICFILLVLLLAPVSCGSPPQETGGNVIYFAKQTSGSVQQQILGPLNETWENNRWITRFKEKLGVDVKYSWLVDQSQYFEKLSLMMSKGELPDVFIVDTNRFYSLYKAGLLKNLDGLFEQYASDDLKAYFADAGQEMWDAVTVDGHLYGIPNLYSPLDRLQYLWIRTDWLKNLNLSEPKNFHDVLDIAQAFTERDPDRNGKKDTFGFGVRGRPDIWREYYSFTGLFYGLGGMVPRITLDESGKVTKSEISNANKKALEKIVALYAEGIIDPYFSTITDQQVTEAIAQNKIGMFFGEHWVPQAILSSVYEQAVKTNPDFEWKAFPIYDMNGEYAKQNIPLPCNGWFVVNKDYQKPETLIRMLNVFLETAREDPEFYMDNEHVKSIWAISPVSLLSYKANVEIYDKANAVLDGQTGYGDVTRDIKTMVDILKKWEEEKSPKSWGISVIYGKGGAIGVLKEYLAQGVPYPPDYYYEIPETAANFGGVLDQIRDQYYLDVILGKKKISDYDNYVSQWLSSGGQLMLDDLNELYKDNKPQ